MSDGWLRWVVCSAILALVYAGMGLAEMRKQRLGPRSYRYAE
jgi:NADH-quinone oxidoreductase subunit H